MGPLESNLISNASRGNSQLRMAARIIKDTVTSKMRLNKKYIFLSSTYDLALILISGITGSPIKGMSKVEFVDIMFYLWSDPAFKFIQSNLLGRLEVFDWIYGVSFHKVALGY
jgi:hypothetical protein